MTKRRQSAMTTRTRWSQSSPDRIRAPWFRSGDFFDPDDIVQVKYEMLRHAQVDGASKAEAAALFGMSRPTFYQAESAFASEGLLGCFRNSADPRAHTNSTRWSWRSSRSVCSEMAAFALARLRRRSNQAKAVDPPTQYRTRVSTQKKP